MAAITNLGTLNSAISAYYPDGPRTDITAALLTDFLNFTQSKLYYGDATNDSEPLRIRQMVATKTLTPATGGTITISTDVSSTWLEFIELTPTTSGARSITYVEPWQFRKQQQLLLDTGSPPFIYTIEGDTLYTAPQATGAIIAAYYQKLTAMSLDADTDWLLTNAPQVYLNGMLAEACGYFGGDEEAGYRAKFSGGIAGLNLNDRRARASGSIMVARPRSFV